MPNKPPETAGSDFRVELEKFVIRAIEGTEEKYQLLVDMAQPEKTRFMVRFLLQLEVTALRRDGELDEDDSYTACGLFDTEEELEARIAQLQRDFDSMGSVEH